MENKNQEEEVFDLGNFSDYDEDPQGTCEGDDALKSTKDRTKKNKKKKDCDSCTCDDKSDISMIDASKICKKCKAAKATLKYRADPTCKACYLTALEHRFRSNLRTQMNVGKNHDEEFLCCISGGQNSLAMLHMLSGCLFNPSARKMFFKVKAIHINESYLYGLDSKVCDENVEKIKNLAKFSNINIEIINIEDVYDLDPKIFEESLFTSFDYKVPIKEVPTSTISESAKKEKLKDLLNSLSGIKNKFLFLPDIGSNKEDILFVLKKLLIIAYAKRINVKRIFFGDTAQKIAIKSLALLCKGRGGNLFKDVSIEDNSIENLSLLRPMNDFLTKEILLYNYFNKLDAFYHFYPKFESFVPNNSKFPGNGSIDTLLENCVDKLQAGFPSTVHTILNTLSKIKPKFDNKQLCPCCFGNRDKMKNILEKGSIIQEIGKTQESTKEIEINSKPFDSKAENLKMKQDYLNTDFFRSKPSLEKISCFACGRIFENSKDKSKFAENLPSVLKINSQNLEKAVESEDLMDRVNFYFINDNDDE